MKLPDLTDAWLAEQIAHYEKLSRREAMRAESITPDTWQRQTRIAACELKAQTHWLHALAFRQVLHTRQGQPGARG